MYWEPFVFRCLGTLALLSAPLALARAEPPVVRPDEAKVAQAGGASDEESPVTTAWKHFNAGRQLVDDGKLSEGLRELLQAHSVPAIEPAETDFYLGLAYDGLHRLDPAILAYRRYANHFPDTLNGRNVKERLTLLEKRRDSAAGPARRGIGVSCAEAGPGSCLGVAPGGSESSDGPEARRPEARRAQAGGHQGDPLQDPPSEEHQGPLTSSSAYGSGRPSVGGDVEGRWM